MRRGEGACLVCGAELTYYQEAKEMTCVFCGKKEMSHASCKEGHYVCDSCHAEKGIEAIMRECGVTASKNPIEIMQKIMEDPYIYMHGPEHHVMAGAALLAAYHNCGGKLDLPAALQEMKERGSQVPGGVCGFWGCCGAGISTGIYMKEFAGGKKQYVMISAGKSETSVIVLTGRLTLQDIKNVIGQQ